MIKTLRLFGNRCSRGLWRHRRMRKFSRQADQAHRDRRSRRRGGHGGARHRPFLEKHLGTSVIIENQPGAGGKIAFEKFQKTEPDGHTLITYTFPKSVIIEYQGKTGFKTRDFTPIFAWSRSSQLLVVNGETWKTFSEFLKAAKAKTLAGGLSGRGSTTHLMGLIALDELGIKANWVPYEGSAGSCRPGGQAPRLHHLPRHLGGFAHPGRKAQAAAAVQRQARPLPAGGPHSQGPGSRHDIHPDPARRRSAAQDSGSRRESP